MAEDDPFDFHRFAATQEPVFERALVELRSGRKRTHWMWFVFPQLRGLGHSAMAHHYGISSIEEARAYLADPLLSWRLRLATSAALDIDGRSAHAIFGSPNDLKFRSSMTLFREAAANVGSPFQQALDRYFDGRPDAQTLDLLDRPTR